MIAPIELPAGIIVSATEISVSWLVAEIEVAWIDRSDAFHPSAQDGNEMRVPEAIASFFIESRLFIKDWGDQKLRCINILSQEQN